MYALYDPQTGRILGRAQGTEPNCCEIDMETWGGICADASAFIYDSGANKIVLNPEYVVAPELHLEDVAQYNERIGQEVYVPEIDAHISLTGDFAHGLLIALTLQNGAPFIARVQGAATLIRMDSDTNKAVRKALGDALTW